MNDAGLDAEKRVQRAIAHDAVASTTPEQRAAWSEAASAALVASPVWAASRRIGTFLAMPGEPDLSVAHALALTRPGVIIAAPRVDWRDRSMAFVRVQDLAAVAPGRHGVPEPGPDDREIVPLDSLDLLLVPGVAFDRHGGRLGRGAGFYDRVLAHVARPTRTVGVCFGCQRTVRIPMAAHDVPVRMLLTEDGLHAVAAE